MSNTQNDAYKIAAIALLRSMADKIENDEITPFSISTGHVVPESSDPYSQARFKLEVLTIANSKAMKSDR
jgi:hypothetical protein